MLYGWDTVVEAKAMIPFRDSKWRTSSCTHDPVIIMGRIPKPPAPIQSQNPGSQWRVKAWMEPKLPKEIPTSHKTALPDISSLRSAEEPHWWALSAFWACAVSSCSVICNTAFSPTLELIQPCLQCQWIWYSRATGMDGLGYRGFYPQTYGRMQMYKTPLFGSLS